MPRNDHRGNRDRQNRGPKKSKLFTIVFLLIVCVSVYYAFSRGILVVNPHQSVSLPTSVKSTDQTTENNTSNNSTNPPPAEKAPPKPRFEFYTLLSKETVPVPHNKNATADVTTDTIPPPEEPKTEKPLELQTPATTPLPAPTGVPAVPLPVSYSNKTTSTQSAQTNSSTQTKTASTQRPTAVKNTMSTKTSTQASVTVKNNPQSQPKKLAPVVEAKPATTSATSSKESQYVLQVAATSKMSDVDALKAQLSFMGFSVSVQPFVHNGVTWYRVKVGPFPSLESAQKARQTLTNNRLSGILIRL